MDRFISNKATVTRSQYVERPDSPSAIPKLKRGAKESRGQRHTEKGQSSDNAASWKWGSAEIEADRERRKGRERAGKVRCFSIGGMLDLYRWSGGVEADRRRCQSGREMARYLKRTALYSNG